MRTLTDIQFWFAQVKVAYALQMDSLAQAKQNGEDIDESLEVRLQAAQTFINDVDWMIENTPDNLIGIVGQIYKIIAFVGTTLPDIQNFYNSQVGNTNIVIGNGVAIPLASNTIYGKVRLSVAPLLSSDPIAVGDNDPRLLSATQGYEQRIVSGSFSDGGVLTLIKGDASSVVVSGSVIMNQSASAQGANFWIDGIAKSAGAVYTALVDNGSAAARVLVTGVDGVVKYRTLAEFSSDINIGSFTANKAIVTNGSGALTSSTTTATEIGYVAGVTSPIQTQINNRQPLDADLTAIAALTADGLLRKTAGVWGMDENNYITSNQTITLSGDVTGAGTTTIVTTIGNDAVTFAKMQNVNSGVILGRSSGSVGNIEQLTIGTGLALTTGVLSSTITQYTDAMARAAISSSATGLSYNNTTGQFTLTAGYSIPSTADQSLWNTAYGNMIVSMGFNTSNGNLTLTQQDGGTIVQDLDGRYLLGNEAITLSGDITGSGTTAIATTISNGAVTFAKMQNISTGSLLGRTSASAGSVEEISVGTGLTLSAGVLSLGTITANRAVVTNVSGALVAATTTATEIGYVNGVTSALQPQIDGKQPLDATLTALAAIGSATPGILVLTGTDSFATRVLEGTVGRITINNASGSGSNPSIDIASNYAGQSTINTVGVISIGAWNASPIADGYIVSAANWNEAYDEKINSLSFSTTTGILTGNQQDGGTITTSLDGRYLLLSGGTMTGSLVLVGDPVSNLQAATKQYVDNLATGIKPKGSVNAATTGTLPSYIGATQTLTGSVNGALSAQDGVTLGLGDYLLVKNESGANEKYNGIYEVTEVGDGSNPYELTRVSNANSWSEIVNATVYVAGGATLQGYTFYQTAATGGTLGTTPITWVVFSISTVYLEGAGIDITGNTIAIATGGVVDSMISASASIALSKLASVTANKALVSDSSGYVAASAVTSTELGYVAGVTSAIQTQINNKQPLDATLTALAAFNSNGVMVQTATDTFTSRTLTGTTNRLDVTNGSGVSGNPTFDISATYVGQSSITTLGTIATGVWQGTSVADSYIASSGNWNSAYNNMIVSASFNTSDGVLTLTQQDAGTIDVDLDGRYAPAGSISGTIGRFAKFTSSGAVGDSMVSESGATININTSVGNNAFLEIASNGGASGVSSMLYGQNSSGIGYLYNRANADIEIGTNSTLRMKILAGGQIITNSATNTGEYFIVGGSARVNGTLTAYNGAGRALTLQKNSAFTGNYYIDYLNSSGSSIAYVGYGSSGNDKFQIYNTLDGLDLYAGTSLFAIGYNGSESVLNTTLRLTAGSTFSLSQGDIYIQTGGYGILSPDASRLIVVNNGLMQVNGSATFSSSVTAGSGLTGGFYNAVCVPDINNIWAFGNATAYGIAYKQGTAGWISSDTIRFDVSGHLTNSSITADFEVGVGKAYIRGYEVVSTGNLYTTIGTNYIKNGVAGDWSIYSANTYTDYPNATLELYSNYTSGYAAPRLSFHWSGQVASQIGIDSTGRIQILDSSGTAYEELIAAEYYTTGWFRSSTNLTGLYNSYNDNYIYSPSPNFWTVASYVGATEGGIVFRKGHEGALQGYVYWDSGSFGLLNNGGNWVVRLNNSTTGGELYGTWGMASGDFSVNGNYLRFDESGTRSWNIRANAGMLNFASGDESGPYNFDNNIYIGGGNQLRFNTYGGGFYMNDTTWIRTYSSKSIWTDSGVLGTQGGITSGYGGILPPSGGAVIAGNTAIGTTDPLNKFVSASDATYNSENTYSIAAASATNPAFKTIIGYDYANDIGVITAVQTGITWKNLSIPQGHLIIGSIVNNGLGLLQVNGSIYAATIANATTNTGKFLVSDGGVVKYRSGAETLADIGAAPASGSSSYINNQSIGTSQSASFDVANDSRVSGRFYIGSNGCYIQEVLIGSTYELRAFDSAGNSTILT